MVFSFVVPPPMLFKPILTPIGMAAPMTANPLRAFAFF